MKIAVAALVLFSALMLGAYRDAQGTAQRRQDSIAALRAQLTGVQQRLAIDEALARAENAKLSRICMSGRLVTDVWVVNGAVSPRFVSCY